MKTETPRSLALVHPKFDDEYNGDPGTKMDEDAYDRTLTLELTYVRE